MALSGLLRAGRRSVLLRVGPGLQEQVYQHSANAVRNRQLLHSELAPDVDLIIICQHEKQLITVCISMESITMLQPERPPMAGVAAAAAASAGLRRSLRGRHLPCYSICIVAATAACPGGRSAAARRRAGAS